jgi:glycosyltransferase involved in cell wall biosynthesis
MGRPLFSVVITTYNYGRFIEESIESVLSQDFPPEEVEVVVVDDGSTDDTAERVRKYGSQVTYLYKPNGGQASALNLGFANARGEIVSLLDGDDFFLPGKLARVAEAFQHDPALGMVYHPMMGWNVRTGERQLSQFPLTSGSPFENMGKFLGYSGPGTCSSFRRRFLERVTPIPEKIRMLADAYPGGLIIFVAPILALTECLSVYRVHGKNSYQVEGSRTELETRKRTIELTQMVVDAMRQWVVENGHAKQRLGKFFMNYWDLYLASERFMVEPPGRLRFLRYLMKENSTASLGQTWKLTTLRYVTAIPAAIAGYRNWRPVEDWRCDVVERAGRLGKKLFGPREGTHPGSSVKT